MNTNLPQIRKENIFTRIKQWFKDILGMGVVIQEPTYKVINEEKKNFREEIKVKSKDLILALQRKINNYEMEISELSDTQLDEMIELYESQIEEKENKIRFYKERLMNN